MITLLNYSSTNTYLLKGDRGYILFDTGWAGTFPALCRALGEKKLKLQDVKYLLISHFHPDHMGIAQEIADTGAEIVVFDVQADYIHASDHIFEKEKNSPFIPIDDTRVKAVPISQSREFLQSAGISGEVLHTPGHSDDSISLWLDKERALFVGDLNPLYELEMHKGTRIGDTWDRLLSMKPKTVYYGHARPAKLSSGLFGTCAPDTDLYTLVKRITALFDIGLSCEEISVRTGADNGFVADVTRMYATHPGVSVQGILDRIEIKGK